MLLSLNWQTNYLFIPLAMAIMFDIRYIFTDLIFIKNLNTEDDDEEDEKEKSIY